MKCSVIVRKYVFCNLEGIKQILDIAIVNAIAKTNETRARSERVPADFLKLSGT